MATATSTLKIIIDVLTGSGAKEVDTLDQKLVKLAAKLGVAALAGKALKKGLDFAVESTKLAGRIETLGAVTEVMGRTAGKTKAEIDDLEESIKAQGITTQAARQALAQMMRAEIDLAKATDLARLAQDAAVISGDNSSQSFEKLTQIIGTGNTFMARRMGLLVDFNGAYEDLAATLGKSTDDLTQLEKVQARTNEVMAQGKTIAGAYEAAMETGGKKASSYARHLEELQYQLGLAFQEPYTLAIDFATETTDFIHDLIEVNNILTDLYNKGLITKGEAVQVKLDILLTDTDAVDAIADLNRVQKDNELITRTWKGGLKEARKEGVKFSDLIKGLRLGTMGLGEANVILNKRLDENAEKLANIALEAADADAVMLSYTNQTEKMAFVMSAAAIEAYELATKQRSVGDEMERGETRASAFVLAYQALSASADAAAAAQERENEALKAAVGYFDSANQALDRTIQKYIENIKWIEAGGKILEAMAQAIYEQAAQGLIPPEESISQLEAIQLQAIDLQLELDLIDTDEAQKALEDMGWEADAAKAKVEKLQSSILNIPDKEVHIDIIETTYRRGGGGPGTHRQHGGPVSAGEPYIVGEVGPELFVPNVAGQIIPTNQVAGKTVNIYQTNYVSPTDTMNAMTVKTMVDQEALTALAQSA